MASAKPLGALSPVPTAVPPWASCATWGKVASMVCLAKSSCATNADSSWPKLMGVASIKWVRPVFTRFICCWACCSSPLRKCLTAGNSWLSTALSAAICIAVGKQSLELWARLTWSFGCTGDLPPRAWPANSLARPAMTSLTFILLWVPLPVCHTTNGKCSSSWPAMTSSAACSIHCANSGVRSPRRWLTRAAAFLICAKAWITASGMRCSPITKFCFERWVWAPQYAACGTSISPMLSVSIRVFMVISWSVSLAAL